MDLNSKPSQLQIITFFCRKITLIIKFTRLLESLEKTYSNWCVTLNPTFLINKIGNIIESNDDKNYGDSLVG